MSTPAGPTGPTTAVQRDRPWLAIREGVRVGLEVADRHALQRLPHVRGEAPVSVAVERLRARRAAVQPHGHDLSFGVRLPRQGREHVVHHEPSECTTTLLV